MEKAHLIESMTLSMFKAKYWHEKDLEKFIDILPGKLLVYRINHEMLKKVHLAKASISKYHMVAHQILLTKVISEIQKIIGENIPIMTDPDLRSAKDNKENTENTKNKGHKVHTANFHRIENLVPDLMFTYKNQKVAIELERTKKNEDAYYEEKRDEYAFKFEKIIFITTQDLLFKKFKNILSGYPNFATMSLIDFSVCYRKGDDPISLESFLSE